MILTYYQAVELMTFLPALLSHADEKLNREDALLPVNPLHDTVDKDPGLYPVWNFQPQAMEVNGADFY